MLELFSFLKSNGIGAQLLDLEMELGRPATQQERESFLVAAGSLISQFEFDIAGISCWSSLNYLSSVAVAQICKRIHPQACIVVGGHHATAVPSDFIYDESPFDFIILGEGEIALLNLCLSGETKTAYPTIVRGTPLDLARDLPLDWDDYRYAIPNRVGSLYLSRGCPFSCNFCMEEYKHTCMDDNGQSKWRPYPVDAAIDRVQRLRTTLHPILMAFHDACFGHNEQWRKDFLRSLKRIQSRDTLYWAEGRGETLDREDIDLLSEMNFEIVLGLESGSPEMLGIMNKTSHPQMYLDRYKETIHYMNERDVTYQILVFFNHPGETRDTYRTSIRYLQSLLSGQKQISGRITAQSFFWSPGSHIFSHLKHYEDKYGTVIRHREWWKEKGDHHELATAVVASGDFVTQCNEPQYWQGDIDNLSQQTAERYSERARRVYQLKMLANLPPSLSATFRGAGSNVPERPAR